MGGHDSGIGVDEKALARCSRMIEDCHVGKSCWGWLDCMLLPPDDQVDIGLCRFRFDLIQDHRDCFALVDPRRFRDQPVIAGWQVVGEADDSAIAVYGYVSSAG